MELLAISDVMLDPFPFGGGHTSYDYDAPITEAGWTTDKFDRTRALFSKCLLPGETIPDGQQDMAKQLYQLLYGSQPIAIGDAVMQSKNATFDYDVRRTWILFGDPSMKLQP